MDYAVIQSDPILYEAILWNQRDPLMDVLPKPSVTTSVQRGCLDTAFRAPIPKGLIFLRQFWDLILHV